MCVCFALVYAEIISTITKKHFCFKLLPAVSVAWLPANTSQRETPVCPGMLFFSIAKSCPQKGLLPGLLCPLSRVTSLFLLFFPRQVPKGLSDHTKGNNSCHDQKHCGGLDCCGLEQSQRFQARSKFRNVFIPCKIWFSFHLQLFFFLHRWHSSTIKYLQVNSAWKVHNIFLQTIFVLFF